MALDNAQLVEYCNSELRVISDKLANIDMIVGPIVAQYHARDLGTIITAGGSTNPVLDGSVTDGRTIVTGEDVFNLITLIGDLQTFLTQGRKDVIAKWLVNGTWT